MHRDEVIFVLLCVIWCLFIQVTDNDNHLLLQPFNGLFSRTTWVSRYQKGETNLDFTGARDSELQWRQLGHYASLHLAPDRQPRQHATTRFLQAGCPSCHPTNSVKALKVTDKCMKLQLVYTVS